MRKRVIPEYIVQHDLLDMPFRRCLFNVGLGFNYPELSFSVQSNLIRNNCLVFLSLEKNNKSTYLLSKSMSYTLHSYHFLQILLFKLYNGPNEQAPLIGTFCGYTPPPANSTTSSALTMVFRTDMSVSMSGFQMMWYQNGKREICYVVVFQKDHQDYIQRFYTCIQNIL